jgi:hypothetical protein
MEFSDKNESYHQAPVVHTCNPSYSGGRDQEDHSSKLVRANSSRDPISTIPNKKMAGGVAQVVEQLPSKCETKPQYCQKTNKQTKTGAIKS